MAGSTAAHGDNPHDFAGVEPGRLRGRQLFCHQYRLIGQRQRTVIHAENPFEHAQPHVFQIQRPLSQ